MIRSLWVLLAWGGVLSGAVCGCSPLQISLHGVSPLNRNFLGEDNSVDVRIYALKDDVAFRQKSRADLWNDPKGALGDAYVEQAEVTILATDKDAPAPYTLKLPESGSFIGILALFQKGEESRNDWCLIYPRKEAAGEYILTNYKIEKKS